MSGISLSSNINAKFLQKLAMAASSGTPSASYRSNQVPSDTSKINFTDALRFGARSFTSIIKNLNTTVSVVNTSEANMMQLVGIIKEMKDVIKKSVEPGVGEPARKRLNSDFVALASKFKTTVVNAKIGTYEILDRDSLAEVFSNIGLSPDVSQSFGKLFDNFLLRPKDPLLASEVVDNSKDVRIPASAFRRTGSPSYSSGKDTNAALSAGASGTTPGSIATSASVYAASDSSLVPPTNTVYVKTATGTSKLSVEAGYDVSLKYVNPASGYSVIESTQDFIGGSSPLANPQLFLVDDTGNVVQQITNLAAGTTLNNISLSSDSKTFLYSYTDSLSNQFLEKGTVASFGDVPSTTLIDSGAFQFDNVRLSSDASHVAYLSNGVAYLRDSGGTGVADPTVSALTDVRDIGFLSTGEVALFRSASGVASTQDWNVSKISYGGSLSTVQSGLYGGRFQTLEENSTSGTGYFSLYDSTSNRISLYDENNLINAISLSATDSIDSLSLAYNADGDVDLGFAGSVGSISGDSDKELYSLRASGSIAKRSTKYDEIFDLSRTIVRKPDAYRLMADIEDLEKYLNKNIETLAQARNLLVENAQVIRATGLAFLSVAQNIKSSDTAESLAAQIRVSVRQNARGALAQAENLDPLIVAALTGGQSLG